MEDNKDTLEQIRVDAIRNLEYLLLTLKKDMDEDIHDIRIESIGDSLINLGNDMKKRERMLKIQGIQQHTRRERTREE